MKKFAPTSKKLLAFLLTFMIVFSMFSGIMEVHAAPAISNIRFIRTINSETSVTKEALYIYGSGFVKPFVRVGTTGTIPVAINATLSNSFMIVVDDPNALSEIRGKINIINVTAENIDGTTSTASSGINLEVIPTIDGISKSKAYVGTPLVISGTQLDALSNPNDKLYVAGTQYIFGTDCIVGSDNISISSVKSPNEYGLSDIRIERSAAGSEIITIYEDSITVVNQLTGIEIERVDPNAGPKNKKNLISIYGKQPDGSNFTSDMRIFVDQSEGVNKGVITNGSGKIIGVKFELPTRANAGTVDLKISSKNLSSEFIIPAAFIYLDIGNSLSIDLDGINPNFKKETENKIIQIKGRNIGFFNGTGYDKINSVSTNETILGYPRYGSSDIFNNNTYFKVKYTGKYDTTDVTIIREFRVMIDGDATVVNEVYESTDYTPIFDLSKDTIYVRPANVNLDPNEPKSVDVAIQTITTIFTESGGYVDDVKYSRIEEYVVKNGFTYLPDEISPTITSIMPAYGPSNQEIYMTITGKDFQVFEDGTLPSVEIGGRLCTGVRVYDNNNKVVDGRLITTGTKLKFKLPAGPRLDGAVNVIVRNPSHGQKTLENGFEFRNQGEDREVKIASVKNNYADLRGGIVSGETVLITGEEFDTSPDNNHRVLITIDGEKATIVGRVSSDGKSVVIIPPPGTVAGPTKLQLINEDGSMDSVDFTYNLVTSNPKIKSIVPVKGGKGTKLIIKGEDFVFPDDSVPYNDLKRKGSVVLLGGMELNAYKYNAAGVITNIDPDDINPATNQTTNIYYQNSDYDGDGDPDDGQMVKVQNLTTIYVDIPDKFYSFVGGTAPAAPYLKTVPVTIGPLKVEVLNPDGAKSKENVIFNYMEPSTSPVIASITPNSGSVAGGTVVTITGSGFKINDLQVYFGSEKSKKVEFINSTLIRATVPVYPYPLPVGQDYLDVPVMVLNYDGGVAVSENGFRYRVPSSNPTITSIKNKAGASTGSSAGNDELTISGLDFRRTSDFLPSGLPKVYFNGREAEVIWPAGNNTTITESLKVISPPSLTAGKAEVVLVNYDSGTCTYNGFTYIMSKPTIGSIMPNTISKYGNVNVQINGSNFREGNLTGLFSGVEERVDRDVTSEVYAKDVIKAIVAFGDEENGDKGMVDTVLGPDYAIIGDLGFHCEVQPGPAVEQVLVSIYKADDSSQSPIERYRMEGGTEVFDSLAQVSIPVGSSHLFIINHKMDLGKTNQYDEGILVETTPSSVIITRRVATYAKIEYNQTRLTVEAPPIDSVGPRNLYVINDDGGTASKVITVMNPESRPVITSIDPKNYAKERATQKEVEYVAENLNDYSELYTVIPLSGGAFLTITGSDFRRNVKVYLDDKQLEIVSKSANDDQLVIKVPPGAQADLDKNLRIVIVNEDGGTFDSSMLDKPHYIRYRVQESNPVVESIVPDRSSSRGNNKIAVNGRLFKLGAKVYIDGIECVTENGYVDGNGNRVKVSEFLSVSVPIGLTPGKKDVRVTNPDFGSVEVADGLTIISTPEITAVYDSEGDAINPLVLSVEGGEKIKLTGIQFMPGIRVIFGGTLKAKSELANGETGLEGLNINNAEMVIVGGTIASGVTMQADGSILCTTPKLDIGSTSLIVINSDGGISNEIRGEYSKPVPDTPGGITVEVVDGDTFRLEWNKIENVNYYELYVLISEDGKKSTGTYEYLGSIVPSEISATRLRYYLDGLMPSTWYNIRIRSVNLFGASKFSTSTGFKKTLDEKVVTFYQDDSVNPGGIQLKDSAVMNGLELTYTLGEQSVGSSTGAVVNFEQPQYIVADPKIVKVSYELLKKYPSSAIKINDKDMELNMKAVNLAVDETTRVEESLRKDMDLRVAIDRTLGAEGDDIRIKMPRGYKIIINPFSINLNMQVQNTTTRIKSFNGNIGLLLKYAESKRSLYPGGIYIAYYDRTTGRIQMVNTQELNGKAQSQISKTGEYVLVGKLVK